MVRTIHDTVLIDSLRWVPSWSLVLSSDPRLEGGKVPRVTPTTTPSTWYPVITVSKALKLPKGPRLVLRYLFNPTPKSKYDSISLLSE